MRKFQVFNKGNTEVLTVEADYMDVHGQGVVFIVGEDKIQMRPNIVLVLPLESCLYVKMVEVESSD